MNLSEHLLTSLSEDDFKTRVIGAAKLYGWQVVHIRPCRTAKGWRTAYEGHAGLPDVILARHGHVILAEIKTQTGRLTSEQVTWLDAAGPNGRVWRPRDWPGIQEELK
jgi:hypothetical protein